MKKLLIIIALLFTSTLAMAGGGGGKSVPDAPQAPPPPPEPQAPKDPNTSEAVVRERTKRNQGGGNADTLLTGSNGDMAEEEDLTKPKIKGSTTLLGG